MDSALSDFLYRDPVDGLRMLHELPLDQLHFYFAHPVARGECVHIFAEKIHNAIFHGQKFDVTAVPDADTLIARDIALELGMSLDTWYDQYQTILSLVEIGKLRV
jgi:hypothetical protein